VNEAVIWMDGNEMEIVSAIIFLVMSIYLLFVAVKGNSTFGYRF
jgi:hypothetical protein